MIFIIHIFIIYIGEYVEGKMFRGISVNYFISIVQLLILAHRPIGVNRIFREIGSCEFEAAASRGALRQLPTTIIGPEPPLFGVLKIIGNIV